MVIAASAPPDKVSALQASLGREQAGALVEDAVARIAEGLVSRGVRKMVVAGGETSGAVVGRLGVRSLRIGAEIDPGVPWTLASGSGAGSDAGTEIGQLRRNRFLSESVSQAGRLSHERAGNPDPAGRARVPVCSRAAFPLAAPAISVCVWGMAI